MSLHFLQRRRLRADLNTSSKVFSSLLDIDPNLFFLPPARHDLRGHPYKVLPASVVKACSVNVFKKRLEKVWTDLAIPPTDWTRISPFPCSPYPTCTPPINSYHLYMLPNSLFYICGFLKPVVAYSLPISNHNQSNLDEFRNLSSLDLLNFRQQKWNLHRLKRNRGVFKSKPGIPLSVLTTIVVGMQCRCGIEKTTGKKLSL